MLRHRMGEPIPGRVQGGDGEAGHLPQVPSGDQVQVWEPGVRDFGVDVKDSGDSAQRDGRSDGDPRSSGRWMPVFLAQTL